MNKFLWSMAAAALLLLPGCFLPSANPLYDDDCIVFREDLLGQYVQGDARRIVSKGEGKSYTITMPGDDDDEKVTLRATLVKLGEEYFVDWEMPVPPGTKCEPPLKAIHMINRVTFEPGKIKFWSFKNPDKLLESADLKIQEYTMTRERGDGKTKVDKQKLVAMAPKDLQKFVSARAAEMNELALTWDRAAEAPKK